MSILIPASRARTRLQKEQTAAVSLRNEMFEVGGSVTALSAKAYLHEQGITDEIGYKSVRELAGIVSSPAGYRQPWIWSLKELQS